MSRRAVASVLGAAALLAASVVGASSASARVSGATAPGSLDFGNVPINTTRSLPLTVTATGEHVTFGADPAIEPIGGAVDEAADYSVARGDCIDTITAGASCTMTVSFRPFAL